MIPALDGKSSQNLARQLPKVLLKSHAEETSKASTRNIWVHHKRELNHTELKRGYYTDLVGGV